MIHCRGRRTAMALACLMFMALVLLQEVEARKLLWAAQEKQGHELGSRGTGKTTTPEPCSGKGGSTVDADHLQGQQQVQRDTSKWAELHTDYIYTQDVKQNP